MSELTPPYPFILTKLKQNKVIPFLGAGASLCKRAQGVTWGKDIKTFLPTANELAKYLADTTQFPKEETHDLTKVAQYYSVVGGREALKEELHSIFNCDYPFAPLHTFLANVATPLLIITTNYDDLIERALDERIPESGGRSRPYDVVIHTNDLSSGDRLLWWPRGAEAPREVSPNRLDIDLQKRTVIYKMHGAVDRRHPERDHYVITEDDYIDFLARMTKNKAIPAIFAEPFQTRHFLFLGYGLNDWNLRVVLNRVEKDLRRPKGITSWAIQYQPRPLERRFWQQRGVEVYDMPLDEFVQKLESCMKPDQEA
jgi:hypothetical protein